MKRTIIMGIAMLGAAVLTPVSAFAHVVVTPQQANVGERVTFSVSIPNERDVDVTSIKLDIPEGVKSVTPTVMPGWTIATEKRGEDVSTIIWNGVIPQGLRADLTFRAQAPSRSGEIRWSAYQTYSDGVTVSWNQAPAEEGAAGEGGNTGPYSVTEIVDDLEPAATSAGDSPRTSVLPLVISGIALLFSVVSMMRTSRGKKRSTK